MYGYMCGRSNLLLFEINDWCCNKKNDFLSVKEQVYHSLMPALIINARINNTDHWRNIKVDAKGRSLQHIFGFCFFAIKTESLEIIHWLWKRSQACSTIFPELNAVFNLVTFDTDGMYEDKQD